jgi:glycosyltransferase involved in cell wall biosynthesis
LSVKEQTASQEPRTSESTPGRPRIVAAIPCFNEDRFIGSVVAKARKFVDTVIVIDDGSTDASAEVAHAAGAIVCRHQSNEGYGAAIRSALEKCRELDAEVAVTLDADGQHDPRDLPNLVEPVLEGRADIVVGSRFLGKGNEAPFYRRVGQRILNAATNLTAGRKVGDSQSGYRAYSSRALHALNLSESGMSVSSEILLATRDCGLTVAEVPIAVSYSGKSKRNPVGHGVSVLARILVLVSLRHPVSLFGIPGLALLAGGLVLGARVLNIYGTTNELAIGSALGTILLCLAGLLALFAALMLQAMKELLRGGAAHLAKEVMKQARDNQNGEEER